MDYVRFEAEIPNGRGAHVGVFGPANTLARGGRLDESDLVEWRSRNDWFDAAYPDPAIEDPTLFNRDVHPLVSCWFKSDALHLIERVDWYLDLLDRHSVAWRRRCTDDPGRVLYEDDVQVVVEPR